MSRIVIAIEMLNGLGIGLGLGLGMFAPFGDGAFLGASVPWFPCTFGAAVTWGYCRYGPSGAAWRPIVSRGRLAHSCQASCQTRPKDCLTPTEKAPQI